MFPNSWVSGPSLVSGRLDRYLKWAAWAELVMFLAGIFATYCWYLQLRGRASPLQYLTVKLVLAVLGAVGALSGIFLSEAMWNFWRDHDSSPTGLKRLWNWVMVLLVIFGSVAYYHLVYRSQIRRLSSKKD
jgi:uncharacterized membrane protein